MKKFVAKTLGFTVAYEIAGTDLGEIQEQYIEEKLEWLKIH